MSGSRRWLSNDAVLVCPHPPGTAEPKAQQDWVTVGGVPLLVGDDPVGRNVVGCPFMAVGITPCRTTRQLLPDGSTLKGHSAFVRVGGQPACLDDVEGFTDGTPAGTHRYGVKADLTGQDLVTVTP